MTTKTIGAAHKRWFEERGISSETAGRYGIYTGRRDPQSGDVVADAGGNILVFPFIERGAAVAEKYRGPNKKFWQRPGGRRTSWNADALGDPALANGHTALIITEGEVDALTAIDCGFPVTVSVPDGAPPVRDGEDPDQVAAPDPTHEHTGKFEFVWNNRERLQRIKRFIIASDADLPGRRLAAELVMRLSASRCFFVTYPEDCNDLNEVRTRHGPEAVAAVLSGARPYPVRGLYTLEDYPETEAVRTFSTGWPTLDRHLQVFAGEFMVITGIPGRGKSTWLLNLLCNFAALHGWRFAVFSPEMPTVPHLRDKLRRILARGPIDRLDAAGMAELDAFISKHFVFIDVDPTGRIDEYYDLVWLLDRAADAVLRYGIKVLVIDPWNEIEHARRRDETMTEYVGRSIRDLKRFARLYSVIVVVVAHPTKDVARGGESRPPSLYDIENSAHWFNKCDHGLVVDWPDNARPESTINVAKVRFEESGELGEVRMRFDRSSGRFEMLRPL